MRKPDAGGAKYFTRPYLERRWETVGRKLAFKAGTVSGWRTWRRRTLDKLRELTGYDTMKKAPLEPKITEELDFGGYRRQRVEIRTEPGVIMPLYVLIPRGIKKPAPAIIALHGHFMGGKAAIAGCRDIPAVARAIKKYHCDYGLRFARAGFIVFCPDARGFGERREEADANDVLASSCRWINNMAVPLGQTITGMWAWDVHRLIDYVQSRRDCRPGKIGCAGLSGGGLQTLWAAALDERIRGAVISGYLYGYKESLLEMYVNCSCNYVPRLWEYVDMGEIAALIAPRPLLVETGDADRLNGKGGLKNVYPQTRVIRKAYRLLGAEKLFRHEVFAGGHRWNGKAAIPWFRTHLT